MATTTPNEYIGKAELSQDQFDEIIEVYKIALGNEDKASDADDHSYYWGVRTALEAVLNMAHGKATHNLISSVDM